MRSFVAPTATPQMPCAPLHLTVQVVVVPWAIYNVSNFVYHNVMIRINTNIGRDVERLFSDITGTHVGILQ